MVEQATEHDAALAALQWNRGDAYGIGVDDAFAVAPGVTPAGIAPGKISGLDEWKPLSLTQVCPFPAGNSRAIQARSPARIFPPADTQGNNFGDRWPLHSFLELGSLPSAVPCARLHVREMLWEWRVTELTDSAELLV